MAVSMVLFEHAAGYGLFRVKEFEEISALQTEVEAAIQDVSAFNSVVSILAFSPFKNAAEALANINAVSEGLATEQVQRPLVLKDHVVETVTKSNKYSLYIEMD
jgi:nucleolar protein 56